MNKAILIGRLGRDPELRHTQSGKAVCNFSVATDSGYGDNKQTDWHRITVWDKQAESCAQYLEKGRQVAVEGRISYRTYKDSDGNERHATEIVAFRVHFLAGGSRGGGGNGQPKTESVPYASNDIPF